MVKTGESHVDESHVRVNFRVVGIYCYIPGYTFGELTSDSDCPIGSGSTIQKVQEAVKSKYNLENGLDENVNGLKIIENANVLTGFAYTFREEEGRSEFSEVPFDASSPSAGRRKLIERIDDPEDVDDAVQLVWQYYVSANLELGSNKIIVARDPRRRNDVGHIQPKYHLTSLDQDLPITDLKEKEYELKAYNIIWRLLAIDVSAEGLEKKGKRRQPTSGRIV